MTEPKAPVESGTYLNDIQTEDVLARLDAMTPSQRSMDLSAVVAGVADILERNPDVTNVAIYMVSDFQSQDWIQQKTTGEDPDAEGLFQPLETWAGGDRGLRVVLVNVGDEGAANLAVTDLGLQRRLLVASTTGLIGAKVGNFSEAPVENVELSLSVGHMVQPVEVLKELGPRQQASVELTTELVRSGWESVRVELPPDALPLDNVRYAAAEVADAIRVVVVNGEPSADHFDDEVTFLVAALRPEGEVFSGNEVVVVDESRLEEVRLSTFHVVILANVYRLSEPAISALERFVRGGGGLLIFLGDQVDPDLYNVALYRDGEGLLPAELTEVIRPARSVRLTITDALHPVMRGLARDGDPLGVGKIAFFEFVGCVPAGVTSTEAADVEGESETGRGAASVGPARVIARFNDPDEHPAMVERRFGRGRVTLVTTAVDKEWHHWPDHPTFLPVALELTRHVVGGGDDSVKYYVGEPIKLALDPATFEPGLRLRTPAYPNEREVELSAVPASDGRGLVVAWEHTETAGQYQFVLRRRDGGETTRLVAVNVDPRESDLAMADEGELGRGLGEIPFEYIKGIDRLTGVTDTARIELWRICLVAAFLVLMSEQFLAWRWGRKGL